MIEPSPPRPNDANVTALVLSDGLVDEASDTAWDARQVSHRVVVLERDPSALARWHDIGTQAGFCAGAGFDVVGKEWRGSNDPVALSEATAGWVLVLEAGERLEAPDAASLHRRLLIARQADRVPTAQDIAVVGRGTQPRLLPASPPVAPAQPPACPSLAARPHCPVCGSFAGFAPLPDCFVATPAEAGFAHPPQGWELLEVASYSCRGCGASDRDRLIWLYLDQANIPPGAAVLEIAPSPALSPRLRARFGGGYRSADLFMAGVDDRVDLCAMDYPDASFDVLICSHVLEHVADDVAAMAEIGRVLRPGGHGILLVPISTLHDAIVEDASVTDPAGRLATFGQDDHVRIYNRGGFLGRLRQAGLVVDVVEASQLTDGRASTFAIPGTGALYVVRP